MTTLKEAVARAWVLSKGENPDEPTGWEQQVPEGWLRVTKVAWQSAARMHALDAFIEALQASGTHVVVPVEMTAEQVARAVWKTSKDEPTQAEKELAAGACLAMSGAWRIDNEGDMVWAVSEMLRDRRAMLSASLTQSEGGAS